jgi:Smg protein
MTALSGTNHTVLDVLMYLFETFSQEEHEPETDHSVLREELLRAGFAAPEVDRALTWLEDLNPERPFPAAPADGSIRIYNAVEFARLDTGCRGYLMYLQHIGILSSLHRELVIDRLMALGPGEIGVEQVKWVVLMVLFSQASQGGAFARMEDLVFEENTGLMN